jgi:RNA polymerase sigma factor (sigma-70 family)
LYAQGTVARNPIGMMEVNSNDQLLFEELFRRHYTLLTARAYELCRQWQMAEDAVQEFFADAWTKKSWQAVTTSFTAYAVKGVQYKTISLLRKSARQTQFDISPEISDSPIEQEKYEDQLRKELQLIDALNELPVQRKEAFLLAHYHNRSYAEIGEQMGISINTVKTHLRLALSQLREILATFLIFLNFF